MPPTIRTHRLELIAGDAALSRAGVGDRTRLGVLLEAKVPKDWPPELMAEDQDAYARRHESDPELAGWLNLFIVRVDRTRTLVGGCGLGGAPNEAGDVMIGYAVLPKFQK